MTDTTRPVLLAAVLPRVLLACAERRGLAETLRRQRAQDGEASAPVRQRDETRVGERQP